MEYLQIGKNQLKEEARKGGSTAIESVEKVEQKRVVGLLNQRRGEMLEILDCVEAKADTYYTQTISPPKGQINFEAMLVSPVITIALALTALVSAAFLTFIGASIPPVNLPALWNIILLLSVLLILGQSIYAFALKFRGKDVKEQQSQVKIMLDTDKAKRLLNKQISQMATDSKAICEMFDGMKTNTTNAFTNDLVKMYTSLYEAKVDNPTVEDFNYGITLAELMLKRAGMKTVPYSKEKSNLFDIQEENYHNEMRYPAIVREIDGGVTLVQKGVYIKNRNNN